MSSPFVPIVSLLASTVLLMVGAGLTGLVVPVRGALEGWSPFEIGLLGTGYAAAFTLGCILAPRVVRRAGHVRAFSALAALLAIAALLHALVVDPMIWVLVRGLTGFSLAGCYMIIESWLNERVTNDTRGLIFSTYMMLSTGGMLAGQAILPTTDPGLMTPFVLCAMFFAAAVIPNALSRQRHPQPLTQIRLDPRGIVRSAPSALSGVFAGGIMAGGWVTMAPLFGSASGFSTQQIALLLIATMAGAMSFQYPLGRLSDRIDRRLVLAGSALFGLAIASAAFILEISDPTMLLVIAFFIGGVIYPVYSLAVAHANDYADPAEFVKISSSLLLVYGVGTMIGPMLVAALIEWQGPEGIFLAVALPSALLAAHTLHRTRRRSAIPPAVRETFTTMPITRSQTPGTIALDPRANAEGSEAGSA